LVERWVIAGSLGLCCCGRAAWGLRGELGRRGSKLGHESPPKRFESSALWRGQIGRQREERHLAERRPKSLELGLELARTHRERLGARHGRPKLGERIS
jgi:hypothetical protein